MWRRRNAKISASDRRRALPPPRCGAFSSGGLVSPSLKLFRPSIPVGSASRSAGGKRQGSLKLPMRPFSAGRERWRAPKQSIPGQSGSIAWPPGNAHGNGRGGLFKFGLPTEHGRLVQRPSMGAKPGYAHARPGNTFGARSLSHPQHQAQRRQMQRVEAIKEIFG